MKKLLRSIFVALVLFALVIPAGFSSKAHATSAALSCSQQSDVGQGGMTVPLPNGQNEQWTCVSYAKISDGVGQQLLYGWVPISINPSPSYWTNLNSGMQMDVEGASHSYGARIHQWSYINGALNQQWEMLRNFTFIGYWSVASVNSSICLGVQGASTAQGAAVVQWGCNGSPDQQWIWVWANAYQGGWPVWHIIDVHSHLCLGISGASQALGAYAVQWNCNNSRDQSWY